MKAKEHIKLVLKFRFASTYIHYDHFFYKNGELFSILKSTSSGWDGSTFPSWRYDLAPRYIASQDKKEWRRHRLPFDRELEPEDFDMHMPYIGKISEVEVIDPPYICPKTGQVWTYRGNYRDIISKRLWRFKIIPKDAKELFVAGDPPWNLAPSKTAFISGRTMLQWKQTAWLGDDHRSFLHKEEKIDRMAVVKSAARKFKRIRIRPISQATINFFKTLGAITHLNKKKPNQNIK